MLEKILDTPIPTLLVIAGFVFLLLSIATIRKPIVIDITDSGRKIAGIIGGILLAVGIVLFLYGLANSDQASTAITPPAPTSSLESTTDPYLDVLSLYTEFAAPGDRPPRSLPIAVPRHIITTGNSHSRSTDQLHVWIIICPSISQTCNIKELKLDNKGEWNDTVDIGNEQDACTSFDVYFVLVSKEVSVALSTFRTNGIRKDDYEGFDYRDKDTFIVVRSLDGNGNDVCLQATK